MTRRTALALAKIAGYHGDSKAYLRVRIEGRVSVAAVNKAWDAGVAARAAGVPCGCVECRAVSS